MGRKNRDLKLELEWLQKYGKEATGIIMDLLLFIGPISPIPTALDQRVKRLKAASAIWDEIRKQKDVFVP